MAFPLSFLKEPLIYKRNFPFPVHLAIVAIKEPQDIRIDFKLKWPCLSTAKLSVPLKIKFPVHSHLKYKLQKVFQIAGVKLIISDFYWKAFIDTNNRTEGLYILICSYILILIRAGHILAISYM